MATPAYRGGGYRRGGWGSRGWGRPPEPTGNGWFDRMTAWFDGVSPRYAGVGQPAAGVDDRGRPVYRPPPPTNAPADGSATTPQTTSVPATSVIVVPHT